MGLDQNEYDIENDFDLFYGKFHEKAKFWCQFQQKYNLYEKTEKIKSLFLKTVMSMAN